MNRHLRGNPFLLKRNQITNNAKEVFDFNNILLMNSTVISGRGIGIVIKTGQDTYIGQMGRFK
jgi:magnesium-transporting ATPase (P-type)